jgi:ribosomal protein L37AE/L43A
MTRDLESLEKLAKTCPTCGEPKRAVTSRTPEGAWKCGCGSDEQRAREVMAQIHASQRAADGAEDQVRIITAALAEARKREEERFTPVIQALDTYLWCLDNPKRTTPKKALAELREAYRTLARSGKEQSG